MPTFDYQVKDQNGKTISGSQEAADSAALVSSLREKGYLIVRIAEGKQKASLFSVGQSKKGGRRGKIKIDDLVVLARQLATMVEAGVPLVQALGILGEQTENDNLKKVILNVRDDVESGKSLSEGLEAHKKVFSNFFVSMVNAGEQSGRLDEILDRLATYIEKTSALQKKVKSALVYPAVVSIMAILITTGMLTFVIPKFAEIFLSLNAALPLPTIVLIELSNFLRTYLLYIVGAIALIIFLVARYINTKQGRLWFDTNKIRVPLFGPLLLKVAVSKFSRTLSTLIKSGVPILASLDIVGRTAGNSLIEMIMQEVRSSIKEGESISGPLSRRDVFPPMVIRMVHVGEETGELEKMLTKIADFYDAQVDSAVDGLTSIIEPLVIAFLAIVIGAIVIAMFLPILTLTSAIK
ncbi:MAG: pilus assembly protein PilC [Candidatus Omnitrophica bacterium CG11_big_fil_rev_8_21_14_0_20_45_26]|uniref:General secretion pathway protein F n=1 Tax=Candidatus Abzuiibacterium crystallinum TaxID=1974748 RepID=A0A2H0LS36_9BACT|nr:MAG: pilus assembly protein PilC [Candidatus Omnitrophica bacterium CG11_big_fil_rev_8_21_14_0_20_45_26]PIW64988.1 MAG: pilus assembly protein PilC [Candidatus Omnitrophica bacterium CG12_big_fil_rev_8_21_14_0_65_45_16]